MSDLVSLLHAIRAAYPDHTFRETWLHRRRLDIFIDDRYATIWWSEECENEKMSSREEFERMIVEEVGAIIRVRKEHDDADV